MKLRTPQQWQKALAMYGLAVGIGIYCNSIMWTHIDSLHSANSFWIKAGLVGICDVSIFWLTTWKLYGPSPELRVFSYWAVGFLLVFFLVHAGAVAKYEASKGENIQMIEAVGKVKADIAAATTSAAIKQSGETAADLNARGQRRSAGKSLDAGERLAAGASTQAQNGITELAGKTKPETFLPDWYLAGAHFWVLMAACGVLLMWAFKIWGDTGLDIDGDGNANEAFANLSDADLRRLAAQQRAISETSEPRSVERSIWRRRVGQRGPK